MRPTSHSGRVVARTGLMPPAVQFGRARAGELSSNMVSKSLNIRFAGPAGACGCEGWRAAAALPGAQPSGLPAAWAGPHGRLVRDGGRCRAVRVLASRRLAETCRVRLSRRMTVLL